MKKHLLSFIGSIIPMISIFFFDAPYVKNIFIKASTGEVVYEEVYLKIGFLMGFGGGNNPLNTSGALINSLTFILSMLVSIIIIIMSVRAMVEKKNAVGKVFVLSSIYLLTFYSLIVHIHRINNWNGSNTMPNSAGNYQYYGACWGIYVVMILFALAFILNLVNYIINAAKKEVME